MIIEGPMFPPRAESQDSFSNLADAEAFLKAQGFWLVPDSSDWTNATGDDAGVYVVEGRYGTVKAWRAEIRVNRRSDHHCRPDETPASADDQLGIAWWNSLTESDCRRWMRIAGDTGRAVDAWRAFKRLRMVERELDPRDVIADLFEELLLDDPRAVAEMVIERLRDAGFAIVPAQKAADSFSQLADAEAFLELRLENERLKAQLVECHRP